MEIQLGLFDDNSLLDIFVSRLRITIEKEMPKLEHEPSKEYNEHIREEVEYRAVEEIKRACKRQIGERNEQWKDC